MKLHKNFNFKFLVIGNFKYLFNDIDFEYINWSKDKEIKDLQKIDIGLYPLSDDESWIMGKSGLKALQYMAIGIPVVATKVGNAKNFIENNQNGFLVNNDEEWYIILKKLLKDPLLRKRVGKNAYETIKENYTTDIIEKKYVKIFEKLI